MELVGYKRDKQGEVRVGSWHLMIAMWWALSYVISFTCIHPFIYLCVICNIDYYTMYVIYVIISLIMWVSFLSFYKRAWDWKTIHNFPKVTLLGLVGARIWICVFYLSESQTEEAAPWNASESKVSPQGTGLTKSPVSSRSRSSSS